MRRAVFFDRDGVINIDHGFVGNIVDFDFIKGVKQSLSIIKKASFITVLVTNQSGIARGYYTEADFKKLSFFMQSELDLYKARFDLILYCPHHPQAPLPEYRCDCLCRKPKPGMILKASSLLNIDLSQSIMIGDRATDLIAAQRAGIKTSVLLADSSSREIEKVPFASVFPDLATYVDSMRNIFKKN